MIILRNKEYSVRPFAKKLIRDSEKLLESGKSKWDVVKELGRAKEVYGKSSRKITSLNPIKLMKNSKDASDSELAISKQMYKILRK